MSGLGVPHGKTARGRDQARPPTYLDTSVPPPAPAPDDTRTTLDVMSVCAHVVSMDTSTYTTQDAMAIQLAAHDAVQRARTEVRIVGLSIDCSVRALPLREQVADGERLRRVDSELAAAQAAFDAAQDLDCPDSGA